MAKLMKTSGKFYLNATALPRVLRRWRQGKQMKIQTAAVELGVSLAAWGHWETGTRFPDGHDLVRLSNYTGIPLHELLCPHAESCPRAGANHRQPILP